MTFAFASVAPRIGLRTPLGILQPVWTPLALLCGHMVYVVARDARFGPRHLRRDRFVHSLRAAVESLGARAFRLRAASSSHAGRRFLALRRERRVAGVTGWILP